MQQLLFTRLRRRVTHPLAITNVEMELLISPSSDFSWDLRIPNREFTLTALAR